MRILKGATWVTAVVGCALGLVAGAPAYADQPPSPAVAGDSAPPAAPDLKSSAPTDAPPPDAAVPAAVPTPVAPTPVPHLASPDNLPPYTTTTSDGAQGSDRLSYLQDVWRAVQDHEISPKQALVLLAQQPMDATAPAGMPAGPQAPVPGPPPAPAPEPVPDASDAP